MYSLKFSRSSQNKIVFITLTLFLLLIYSSWELLLITLIYIINLKQQSPELTYIEQYLEHRIHIAQRAIIDQSSETYLLSTGVFSCGLDSKLYFTYNLIYYVTNITTLPKLLRGRVIPYPDFLFSQWTLCSLLLVKIEVSTVVNILYAFLQLIGYTIVYESSRTPMGLNSKYN